MNLCVTALAIALIVTPFWLNVFASAETISTLPERKIPSAQPGLHNDNDLPPQSVFREEIHVKRRTDLSQPGSPSHNDEDDHNREPSYLQSEGTSSTPDAGWVTILYEDPQGDFPSANDWTVYDGDTNSGDDYWDDLTCRAYSGSWSIWAADIGDMTNCDHYDNYMDAWMIYGPFDLSDAQDAELNFRFWNDSEIDWDWFGWWASSDGVSFSGTRHSGNSSGWSYRSLDLSSLIGDPSVWVAFTFESDGSVSSYEGAYVDNIELRKYVTSEPDLSSYINALYEPWQWGSFVSFEMEVVNEGTAASGAFWVDLVASNDTIIGDTDDMLIEDWYVSNLDAAGIWGQSWGTTLPASPYYGMPENGTVYYGLYAYPVVGETDTADNHDYDSVGMSMPNQSPEVTILSPPSPPNGSTIDYDDVTFSWQGSD
ncbi:MAG: hypothetical protein JXA14_08260, partial [Anaerolineae bacterium]|nr:hypothetical protein [Anaerolineae bacterium]